MKNEWTNLKEKEPPLVHEAYDGKIISSYHSVSKLKTAQTSNDSINLLEMAVAPQQRCSKYMVTDKLHPKNSDAIKFHKTDKITKSFQEAWNWSRQAAYKSWSSKIQLPVALLHFWNQPSVFLCLTLDVSWKKIYQISNLIRR